MTTRGEMQAREIEILNFLRPYLKDPPPDREDGTWSPPPGLIPDLTRILVTGREWLTHEARKKEIRAYRRQLEKALAIRDKSPALKHLFPATHDFPKADIPIRQDADALMSMVAQCDKILGTAEPKRYPRREIVRECLIFWKKFTGKVPPRNAHRPAKYSEIRKETAPYTFSRLILSVIEDCNDTGDFSGLYETIQKTLPLP